MDEQEVKTALLSPGESKSLMAGELVKGMLETAVEYKELRMMYACAIKEVQTKFEVLETEFKVRYQRNPIAAIQTRLKSSSSIVEKMIRKGIPFSLENLEAEIHDLAGIRVICSYVDDIYALADALTSQDDITLVERKDYISSPKPNGYRSLHLIVSVPVFFSQQTRQIRVEVQIRTIAMDFWASLEHQMKYKREIPDQQHIVAQLKSCAEDIARVDQEMMNIRLRLEASADEPSEDDLLIARLKKLDTPIL